MASEGASLVSLICAQTAIRGLKRQHEAPCKFSREKKEKPLWFGAGNHLFLCWYLSRLIQMSEKLYISAQNARLLSSFGVGGGVGRRVNFKPPLSIVGSVSACFGNIPCKLCIQRFTVHVHTLCMCTQTQTLISVPVLCRVFTSKLNEMRNEIRK